MSQSPNTFLDYAFLDCGPFFDRSGSCSPKQMYNMIMQLMGPIKKVVIEKKKIKIEMNLKPFYVFK